MILHIGYEQLKELTTALTEQARRHDHSAAGPGCMCMAVAALDWLRDRGVIEDWFHTDD